MLIIDEHKSFVQLLSTYFNDLWVMISGCKILYNFFTPLNDLLFSVNLISL